MAGVWTKQYDAGVSSALTYPDCTLPDLLVESARTFPTRTALHYYGRRISYRTVHSLVERYASGLTRLGIRKGDVVGIMLPNLPQTVIGFYGALRAGATVTTINPLYVEGEIEQQAADARCETLLALTPFFPRIEPLLKRNRLKRLILTGPEDFLPFFKRLLYPLKERREGLRITIPSIPGVLRFRDVLRGPIVPSSFETAPDDLALLQYTGGTTGLPKGVMLTHRNLVANTWQCRNWMPTLRQGQERFLAVLPFFHVYGMSACQNLALSLGASLSLLPRFQVREVLETIVRDKVTVFPGIPAMYAAINQYQQLGRYDLQSIRLCLSGAGPLHPSVQERFESITGAKLVEGYGLTEASPVTHANPINQPREARRQRSIGLPFPDTDAKIMDVESGSRELPVGEVGELVIRGPQVMQGYLKRAADTGQVLRDGWLYTGDMARMDADGFFYIADRKKDMIKSGGENVYPREVEEVLYRHPKVKEAVVAGIPMGMRGELIKAYVVLKDGEKATTAELLEHCRESLAKFKVPRKVEFRADLPKTLVGKVLRRLLVEEELKKSTVEREDGTE